MSNDQKYGFLREWMLMAANNPNIDPERHFQQGYNAWKMLQDMPEGGDKDTEKDPWFKHSPEE